MIQTIITRKAVKKWYKNHGAFIVNTERFPTPTIPPAMEHRQDDVYSCQYSSFTSRSNFTIKKDLRRCHIRDNTRDYST